MKKAWLILSSVMLAVVLIGAGGCVVGEGAQVSPPSISVAAPELGGTFGMVYSQQQVGLWVTGEGKTMATPDVVLLSLGIEAEAKTVAQAQQDAAAAMDGVMKALKSNGVAEKDIQTQTFSIYPVRKWVKDDQREIITGYRVTNIVVAKIRQVDKAGTIIDDVAEVGGNLTRIDSIGFTVDDPTPYYKEARAKAIGDAIEKAKQMAQVANIKLGKLLYISEGTSYMPPVIVRDYAMKAEGAAPAPTPISPGELEVQVTVQMVYDIR
ncbi:MAG: SIMPL domain-containing protein [Chloroflexi bacterium]|nr:SIMPL domain-containing protein [Chloroflexota bacterium]MBL7062514.1 SIMPL domain-containing protein [Dehalococcoidia bacterium]